MSDQDLLARTTSILKNALTELEGTVSANRTNKTIGQIKTNKNIGNNQCHAKFTKKELKRT